MTDDDSLALFALSFSFADSLKVRSGLEYRIHVSLSKPCLFFVIPDLSSKNVFSLSLNIVCHHLFTAVMILSFQTDRTVQTE